VQGQELTPTIFRGEVQWVKQVQNQVSDPRVIFRKGSPKRKVTDRVDQVKSLDWLWGREEWYNDRPDPRGETDYAAIAEHFNTLHELLPALYDDAASFISYCKQTLAVDPETRDFEKDFQAITQKEPPVKG